MAKIDGTGTPKPTKLPSLKRADLSKPTSSESSASSGEKKIEIENKGTENKIVEEEVEFEEEIELEEEEVDITEELLGVDDPKEIKDLEKCPEESIEQEGFSIEKYLSFLSSRKKEKTEDSARKDHKENKVEPSDLEEDLRENEEDKKDKDEALAKKLFSPEHIFRKDPSQKSDVNTDMSVNFNSNFVSCYLLDEFSPVAPNANIFIREIPRESDVFKSIIEAHNSQKFHIASPFKFIKKQDFVSIFQKAFLGVIFDLSYSYPYYYTQEGTHHIYFSSFTVEHNKTSFFTMLDLIPKKAKFYDKKSLNEKTDFVHFSVHRILLVSVNALFV